MIYLYIDFIEFFNITYYNERRSINLGWKAGKTNAICKGRRFKGRNEAGKTNL